MVNIKENFSLSLGLNLHPAYETLFYNVIYVICDFKTSVGGSIYD